MTVTIAEDDCPRRTAFSCGLMMPGRCSNAAYVGACPVKDSQRAAQPYGTATEYLFTHGFQKTDAPNG